MPGTPARRSPASSSQESYSLSSGFNKHSVSSPPKVAESSLVNSSKVKFSSSCSSRCLLRYRYSSSRSTSSHSTSNSHAATPLSKQACVSCHSSVSWFLQSSPTAHSCPNTVITCPGILSVAASVFLAAHSCTSSILTPPPPASTATRSC